MVFLPLCGSRSIVVGHCAKVLADGGAGSGLAWLGCASTTVLYLISKGEKWGWNGSLRQRQDLNLCVSDYFVEKRCTITVLAKSVDVSIRLEF